MREHFERALRDWWLAVWPLLLESQRTYVESGYRDDRSFAQRLPFEVYEWTILTQIVNQDDFLRSRLTNAVRTALGGSAANALEAVGRELLQRAYQRVKGGRLLVGDAQPVFDELYSDIPSWIFADDFFWYEALTVLNNVRSGEELALDEQTSIRMLSGEEKKHQRWDGAVWDDRWEPSTVLSQRIALPFLGEGDHGDTAGILERLQVGARDVLLALAVVAPTRATLGMMSVGSYGWAPGSGFTMQVLDYPFPAQRVMITPDRRDFLVRSWRAVRASRRVRIATEYISDPRRLLLDPEKALIDVVTAIEAIAGEDSSRRLQRRICLYCARIVAADLRLSQRQIYDGLMSAFSRRERALRGAEVGAEERATDNVVLDLAVSVARRFIQLRVLDDERLKRPVLEVLLEDPA